ncbi:hypothetical protein RCH06_001872 [Polaromonas sp. CG_9.5]|uniref:hypothetical protein n=1 Tax=Polaromonas sp. CG_9.5 TaxID=3071705 RepID=UPI002E03F4BF|nr:hypothetical protein [Polaromonas sp. CG_9.5]
MIVNDYLAKDYGLQGCWSLVADVVATETGATPLTFRTINRSVRQMASEFRIALSKGQHGYVESAEPVNLCIVLLGKTERVGIHHCGIYFEGKVLHALTGITLYEELSVIRDAFEVVQFWAKA